MRRPQARTCPRWFYIPKNARTDAHPRSRRKPLPVAYALVALGLGALLLYLCWPKAAPVQAKNIGLSDVVGAISAQPRYVLISQSNLTNLSRGMAAGGYKAVSVAVFNATNITNESAYPQTVSSSIFVTASPSTAAALIGGISNALEQDIEAPNGTATPVAIRLSTTDYSYSGVSVTITSMSGASRFNATPSGYMPGKYALLESWSGFQYGDYAGIVVSTGYTHMGGNFSTLLAERLFQNIAHASAPQ